MEKRHDPLTASGSPFFELLADADEIKVREIRSDNRDKVAGQLERSLEEMETSPEGTNRTFFIHIRSKPAPPPTPVVEPNPENRLYLLKSADLLLEEGDFLLARNIYSFLLKDNLRDPEAMKGLGMCFVKLGDPTAARKCFRALGELNQHPECYFWLGQCDVMEGKDDLAVENFRKVTEPSTLRAEVQFELYREWGNCENRQGNFDQAWSLYHKALSIFPSSDVVYVNLGTLEIQRQHPEVALSYFSKAIELNPKSSRAYCGLGLVATARSDKMAAQLAFETALDLDAQNLMALYQLLAVAEEKEDRPRVRARIETFLAKSPKHADVRYALAFLHYKGSDWTSCRREIEGILAIEPNHARAKGLRDELDKNKHLP